MHTPGGCAQLVHRVILGPMQLYVALAIGLLGVIFGLAALGLHWVRRSEHPDVTRLKLDMNELIDKTEHFMRRERTRRIREANEPAEPEQIAAPQPAAPSPHETKDQLRRRFFQLHQAGQ